MVVSPDARFIAEFIGDYNHPTPPGFFGRVAEVAHLSDEDVRGFMWAWLEGQRPHENLCLITDE